MKEEIRVMVEKDGKVTFQVKGVVGSRCLSVTKFLEEQIGEVLDRQKTSDFYKSDKVTISNTISQDNARA
jgi:hypothetical protein